MASSSSKRLDLQKSDLALGSDKVTDIPGLGALLFSYVDDSKEAKEKHQYQRSLKLLGNMASLYERYAAQIAHNLLWHVDIDNTLRLANNHPEFLNVEVEIKDIHGQRIYGKPLQILASAQDVNLHGPKPIGMVERLRSSFQDENDFRNQLNQYFNPASEENTMIRMAPYITAMQTFCSELINLTISSDLTYKKLLDSQITEKFRRSFAVNSSQVVSAGLVFDLSYLLVEFSKLYNDNVQYLGGLYSPKTWTLFTVIYGTLQKRGQCCDIEIAYNGVGRSSLNNTSGNLDFSKGIPPQLEGLGCSYFLDGLGYRKSDFYPDPPSLGGFSGIMSPPSPIAFLSEHLELCRIKKTVLCNLYNARSEVENQMDAQRSALR